MDDNQKKEIEELIKKTLLQSTPKKYPFELGDIVALNSHPFLSTQHDILIGGEPQQISPLMIIVEIIGDSQNLYDENIGNQIQAKGGATAQCKCMWYSSKSFQFEEAWLSSKLLKKIDYENNSILNEKDEQGKSKHLQIGASVTLCTAQLELKKLKSSYKNEGGKERSSINPLLSFVSPIMQIIGTAKNESKEPLYDSKTGNKKKEVSQLLIKCKWFNPSSEKMSEKLIPIEALSLIPKVDEVKLKRVSDCLKNEYSMISIKGNEIAIKAQQIKFIHGFYELIGYDYIANSVKQFELNSIEILEENFNLLSKRITNYNRKDFKEAIVEAAKNCKYIRIQYYDKKGNATIRAIKDFSVLEEGKDSYLAGYCTLRDSDRHFHFDRIQFLEVLNLKQPVSK